MYACILEIGRGFFEGVCGQGNQPLAFRDPPHPGIRELTLEDPPSCPWVWVYVESRLRTLEDAPSTPFGG
jgi:hypothetical protein